MDPLVKDDPLARRVMEEAPEFDLKEGFALSLRTLDQQTCLFSAGGQHFEMSPDTQGVLTLVANYAIGRAIMIKQEASANKPIMLSAREREALQWAAEGKADWEIGAVMKISEHGADKHMRYRARETRSDQPHASGSRSDPPGSDRVKKYATAYYHPTPATGIF